MGIALGALPFGIAKWNEKIPGKRKGVEEKKEKNREKGSAWLRPLFSSPFGVGIVVIQCPHCRARLSLPGNAEGSYVRCAICRRVFRADQDASKESDGTGSPESPPTATPQPREGREGYRAEDHHREYLGPCDFSSDSRELIENAKSLARPAGYAMLAALFFTAADLLHVLVVDVFARSALLPQGPEDVAITCCCHLFLYGTISIFIAIGARSLFTLGSRGLIVTAVAMNFVRFFISSCIVVLNLAFTLLAWAPAPDLLLTLGIVINVPVGLANVTAAVMAIRVLMFREVADAYAARAVDQLRRRF
jgi:hypothetical protein